MSYTPPAGNALAYSWPGTAYTPPGGAALAFNFVDAIAPPVVGSVDLPLPLRFTTAAGVSVIGVSHPYLALHLNLSASGNIAAAGTATARFGYTVSAQSATTVRASGQMSFAFSASAIGCGQPASAIATFYPPFAFATTGIFKILGEVSVVFAPIITNQVVTTNRATATCAFSYSVASIGATRVFGDVAPRPSQVVTFNPTFFNMPGLVPLHFRAEGFVSDLGAVDTMVPLDVASFGFLGDLGVAAFTPTFTVSSVGAVNVTGTAQPVVSASITSYAGVTVTGVVTVATPLGVSVSAYAAPSGPVVVDSVPFIFDLRWGYPSVDLFTQAFVGRALDAELLFGSSYLFSVTGTAGRCLFGEGEITDGIRVQAVGLQPVSFSGEASISLQPVFSTTGGTTVRGAAAVANVADVAASGGGLSTGSAIVSGFVSCQSVGHVPTCGVATFACDVSVVTASRFSAGLARANAPISVQSAGRSGASGCVAIQPVVSVLVNGSRGATGAGVGRVRFGGSALGAVGVSSACSAVLNGEVLSEAQFVTPYVGSVGANVHHEVTATGVASGMWHSYGAQVFVQEKQTQVFTK